MLRNIHLHGDLAERFGPVFRLAVETPVEAVRALTSQLPGLEQRIREGEFICIRGDYTNGVRCDEELLTLRLGSITDFHLVPATVGHGEEAGKIILGVILIGVGFFTGQTWVMGIGASLVLGGTAMALTTMPSATGENSAEDRPGYLFNGAVNSSEPGGCVPLVFGRIRAGSVVVSAGVTAERLSGAVSGTSGGSSTGSIGQPVDPTALILLDRLT